MKKEKVSILEMSRGAILEQADIQVGKIIRNIYDPNTSAIASRTLTITVNFKPSADRSTIVVTAGAKSKLQPPLPIQSSLYVGADRETGEIQAVEMTPQIPGQLNALGEEQEYGKIIRMEQITNHG